MPRDLPLSPLADTVPVGSGQAATPGVELARGASVGRYLILQKVGAGGMGIVYAAYDPKLDRRVALKALHVDGDPERDTAGRSRLFREAQAMARLSHPNVVTVYDVLVEASQVFVAMELIEGESLHQWLHAKRRAWSVILDAFLQAGRGLAAAHQAGIVHRDFKLDNVLVGTDGRARVGDFGLARAIESANEGRVPETSELGQLLSREGAVVGTPAYMAPAQLRGAPADARSDQFSFCAALYEALYGEPPFGGTTLLSLVRSMDSERVKPPPTDSAVPGWLRAIVIRGLRARPEDRFASMQEVLSALETDPRVKRRRGLAAGVIALAIVGVIALVARDRRAAALECRAAGHRLDGVWDDGQRRAVQASFIATGRPYADDTFARTSRALDDYANEWSRQAVASCADRPATVAERELHAQRAQCLGARFGDLRAFVGVLARAGQGEGETVDRAVQGARALPSLEVCAGSDPLRGRAWPSDPAVRTEAHALEDRMSLAMALRAAGRYADGTELASKNALEAARIGFRPLEADALLALAQVQLEAGELKTSAQSFHRASVVAEAASAEQVAARGWIAQAREAEARGDYAAADQRFDHAGAWVERVGNDEALRADLLLARGDRLADEGRYDDARPFHEKALAIYERLGSDEATRALNALGIDADQQGLYDEARTRYTSALERYERLLGPEHPKVARELNNIGLMAADQDKNEEAIAALERALRIRERALGPQHPDVAVSLYNLALVYEGAKRFAEGLAVAQRGVDAVEKAFGPDGPDMAYALTAVGGGLLGLHRAPEAIAPYERALAIRGQAAAPINLADAKCGLGESLLESKRDVARGRQLLKEARALFVSAGRSNRLDEIDEWLKEPAR